MRLSERRIGNLYGGTGGNFAAMVYDKSGICPTLLNMGSGGGRMPHILVPMNPDDGSCRTIKAQCVHTSVANYIRNDSMGASGVIVIARKIDQKTR